MKSFREIEVEADSPGDAARHALEIQRDSESVATVFMVDGQRVDLCHRCNLCGDQIAGEELREHLRAHAPAADSALGSGELERFFYAA